MNPYPFVKKLLFSLDAETAHDLTLTGLAKIGASNLVSCPPVHNEKPIELMGLRFGNRVGLAAGLDKNGIAVDGLAALGFGFIEVGTVTPLPQPGNPKPRLFRLVPEQAIINRMGFNNHGVDALLANLKRHQFAGVLGINIGKNAATAIESAADDYLICLEKAFPRADYITVNISSPNTKNLRQLQGASELDDLLGKLKARQRSLTDQHGRYVPLVLKIAPDLEPEQIQQVADALRRHGLDGVIATNTTLGREGVANSPHANETGGLSGKPVFEKSTAVVRALANALAGEVPIVAAGGISCGADAKAKIDAGASLVQIYSGLIFQGPPLVTDCRRALAM
jgi:dihydroorotate dehydrogenase